MISKIAGSGFDIRGTSSRVFSLTSFPHFFWAAWLVLACAFALFFLDRFQVYTGEMTLLLTTQSVSATHSADRILDTITALPESLQFYDRLVKEHRELADPWLGLEPAKRRKSWNEHILVERAAGSLLRVIVTTDTSESARVLAESTAETLFRTIGLHYDIEEDVTLTMVDGPIVRAQLSQPLAWLFLSLLLSFIATALIFLAGDRGRKVLRRITALRPKRELNIREMLQPKRTSEIKDALPWKSIPEKPLAKPGAAAVETRGETLSTARKVEIPGTTVLSPKSLQKKSQPETQEFDEADHAFSPRIWQKPSAPSIQKATAPANLPVVGENFSLEKHLFGETTPPAPEDTDAQMKTSETMSEPVVALQEPSAEELKRRLNELLAGGK